MVSKFFSGLRSRSHFFRLYAMNQVETEKTKIPENCKRKKPTTSNEEEYVDFYLFFFFFHFIKLPRNILFTNCIQNQNKN